MVFGEMWALQRGPGEPLLPIEVEGTEVKINIIVCFLFRQLRYLESGMNPGPYKKILHHCPESRTPMPSNSTTGALM